ALSSTISAPDAAATALSFGQPSRGRTRRKSSRPQFIIARAAVPIFSPSCGSTRMIAGPPVTVSRLWFVPAIVRDLEPPLSPIYGLYPETGSIPEHNLRLGASQRPAHSAANLQRASY